MVVSSLTINIINSGKNVGYKKSKEEHNKEGGFISFFLLVVKIRKNDLSYCDMRSQNRVSG